MSHDVKCKDAARMEINLCVASFKGVTESICLPEAAQPFKMFTPLKENQFCPIAVFFKVVQDHFESFFFR